MKFEQVPSQEELEKSRSTYEKLAEANAESINSDKKSGKEVITKDDVMHVDALAENAARHWEKNVTDHREKGDKYGVERQGLLTKIEAVDIKKDGANINILIKTEGKEFEISFVEQPAGHATNAAEFERIDFDSLKKPLGFDFFQDDYHHRLDSIKCKIDGVEVGGVNAAPILNKYGNLIRDRYLEQLNVKKEIRKKDNREKELGEKRDAYSKNAAEIAKENNSFVENIKGEGHSAEDIYRYEAAEEEKLRKDLAAVREKIANQTLDKNARLTAQSEEFEQMSRLWKEQNSSLFMETVRPIREQIGSLFGKGEMPSTRVMKGLIEGKKVKIEMSPNESWQEAGKAPYSINPKENPEYFTFKGTLDGKKISPEEALKLFKEYRENAAEKSI